MKFKPGAIVFFILLASTTLLLFILSNQFVRRSLEVDRLADEIHRAENMGEIERAARLRTKAVFYSGDAAAYIRDAGSQPALASYLSGLNEIRRGRTESAEPFLRTAADADSPLLAARAHTRLEEIRYKTALPNAERIPF